MTQELHMNCLPLLTHHVSNGPTEWPIAAERSAITHVGGSTITPLHPPIELRNDQLPVIAETGLTITDKDSQ